MTEPTPLAEILFDRYRLSCGDAVAKRRRYRTVAVVGAGVSRAACGLPNGDELARAVRLSVTRRTARATSLLVSEELDRLEAIYQLPRQQFETQLLAMSKFDPRGVVRVLQQRCGVSHYPSLTYEILAHLLKHGYLDAIINFNFDELLDQALDEELGPYRYTRIVTGGDAARWRLGRHNLGRPLYIKPHGSASEPQSLRFTREAYLGVTHSIGELLRDLIEGRALGRSDLRVPVCVLALGYGLQDFEFNRLFTKTSRLSKLFVVSSMEPNRASWPELMREIEVRPWIHVDEAVPVKGKRTESDLDRFMRNVWSRIAALPQRPGLPRWLSARGIERHEVIAGLFSVTRWRILKRQPGSHKLATYLTDRILVELALAIAKSKGFVDLREVDQGRPGRLYRLLVETRPNTRTSLRGLLEHLGMELRDASAESYWHRFVPRTRKPNGEFPLTLNPRSGARLAKYLVARCYVGMSQRRRKRLREGGSDLFGRALEAMFDGGEVEVAEDGGKTFRSRFNKPGSITTLAQMRRATDALLDSPWCLLLCVAESGTWLLDYRDLLSSTARRRGVVLIAADEARALQVATAVPGVLTATLPWHLHNRHMTIAIAPGANGTFSARRAIFFERRYRSSQIIPTVLDDPRDCERVLDDFVTYWLKAERYAANASEVVWLSRGETAKERRRVVRSLADALLGS